MNNGTAIAFAPTELRIIKADAPAIERHWNFIRDRLVIVKDRTNNPSANGHSAQRIRWMPTQVRFALLSHLRGQGSTELFFVLAPDDEIRGFFVTTTDIDPFQRIPMDFFVWITWSDGAFDVIDMAEPEIVKLALARGCVCIKGLSAREGYARRLRRKGYYVEYMNVRKDLVSE